MSKDCIEVSVYGEKNYRLFLDVIKQELVSSGCEEITSTQALILLNINENVVTTGEVITKGYYIGSNASYNVKKLVNAGYLTSVQSDYDKRTILLKLTEKGLQLCDRINKSLDTHMNKAEKVSKSKLDMKVGLGFMKNLERFWNDVLRNRED